MVNLVNGKNVAQNFRLVNGKGIHKRNYLTLGRRHLSGNALKLYKVILHGNRCIPAVDLFAYKLCCVVRSAWRDVVLSARLKDNFFFVPSHWPVNAPAKLYVAARSEVNCLFVTASLALVCYAVLTVVAYNFRLVLVAL